MEDASVHWLDRLHAILSSCANGVQLMTKDQNRLQEVEQAAASTLAQHAETACSHLQEIHQQQVISMREAVEAAKRVEDVELELQERSKEAAAAAAARDALEQAQQETLCSLHAAEMRASQAETSCSQLRSQLQFIASERRRAAAEQESVTARSVDADSGVAGVLDSCQNSQHRDEKAMPAVAETECHEEHATHLPAAGAALDVSPKEASSVQGCGGQPSEASVSSEQRELQLGDVQPEHVGVGVAVQCTDAASAEKQVLADQLASAQGALESTEAMVLDLQMRLGHTEEKCRQHEAAARSSSALSDATQKLLLVAETRATEAENQVACYQENAAKSSKAMLLAHIRADDAEQALSEEGDAQEVNSSSTQGVISQDIPISGTTL